MPATCHIKSKFSWHDKVPKMTPKIPNFTVVSWQVLWLRALQVQETKKKHTLQLPCSKPLRLATQHTQILCRPCNFTQTDLQFLDLVDFPSNMAFSPLSLISPSLAPTACGAKPNLGFFLDALWPPKIFAPEIRKSAGGSLLGPPDGVGTKCGLKVLPRKTTQFAVDNHLLLTGKKGTPQKISDNTKKKWVAKVMEADGSEFSFSIAWFLGSIFSFQGATQNCSQYLGAFFRRINLGNASSATAALIGTPWKQSLFTLTWSTQNT